MKMANDVRVITGASDEQLRDRAYWNDLKLGVAMLEIGQRDWPTAIADMFLRQHLLGTRFQFPVPLPIPEIDRLWGNERYYRTFVTASECEFPQKDRMFDIYMKVKHPKIARHFGR